MIATFLRERSMNEHWHCKIIRSAGDLRHKIHPKIDHSQRPLLTGRQPCQKLQDSVLSPEPSSLGRFRRKAAHEGGAHAN